MNLEQVKPKLEQISPNGEKHGLINTVANSVQDNGFKYMTPETKAKAEKQKKEDSRIVKARYINKIGANERLTRPYCNWAGDPIQMWHFIPDHIYDLPVGLVNDVNAPHKAVPKRSDLLDAKGKPTIKDEKGERIHEFVPVSF